MNIRLLRTCLVATAGIFIITGCGGGGLLGTSGASLNLSRSAAQIAYGESVTISWSSSDVIRLVTDKTNIKVDESTVDGSLLDRPSHDTTYTLVGFTSEGDEISRSITVNVVKSAKKFVLVADAAVAGVPQVQEFLQTITTTPVTVSTGIPSLTGIDVLVILESASIGTAQQSTIQSHVNSGGAVVMVGLSSRRLATGNINNSDISSIGSWFAGATVAHGGGSNDVVDTSPVGFPLSSVILDDNLYNFGNGATVGTVSASAYTLTKLVSGRAGAFAYKPTTGGKVGFIADAPIGSFVEEESMRYLFLTICRWAADGS